MNLNGPGVTSYIDLLARADKLEAALRFVQAGINHSAMQDNKMVTEEFAGTISRYIDTVIGPVTK